MSRSQFVYEVELLCDHPQWWRFNVYIMIAGYDDSGNRSTFNNLIDRVYDPQYTASRQASEGYDATRILKLASDPCAWAEAYVYVVANTFPDSPVIKESRPFPLTMKVSAAGKTIEEVPCEVNPWGGLTIVAHRMAVEDK